MHILHVFVVFTPKCIFQLWVQPSFPLFTARENFEIKLRPDLPLVFVMASNQPAAPPSEGIVSNIQNFVSENKKLVIGVAAAAVATTLAVVLYTSNRAPVKDVERGEEKKSSTKKKTKSSKAKNNGSAAQMFDPNGPILEEIPKDDTPTCKVLSTICVHAADGYLLKHLQF
jgi:hypothetical protein